MHAPTDMPRTCQDSERAAFYLRRSVTRAVKAEMTVALVRTASPSSPQGNSGSSGSKSPCRQHRPSVKRC